MQKVLRSAVIGTGTISQEHLRFLARSEQARLVAVCDLSPAAARYAAQRFQADTWYSDYHKMLAEVQMDVVHILTPPHTHKSIAIDCLEAGKHVFCEKPITPTYSAFKELWAIAQANNRHLIENHNYRFNAPIIAIKQMVQEELLGEVQEVEVRNVLPLRSGGRFADEHLPSPLHAMPAGAIHDFITHLCSLALHFVPKFERVRAAWNNHDGGTLFKYDDLDAILVGGSQHARIRFSCATYPPCFTVTVRGTRGYAETDIYQPYLCCVVPRAGGLQLSPMLNHWINGWGLIRASLGNVRNKVMQRTTYEGLQRILAKTYDALIHGAPMPVSFVDMERTSWLIDALLAEENRV